MITQTAPTTDEIFVNQQSISRNKWVNYIPASWSNFRYEGMIAPDETTTGLGVLYGGYLDNDNNSHGIITLFNNDFEPIKTIYEYSSGAPLRYIQYMKQSEDGTFYFIDDAVFSFAQRQQVITSQKRFVMVNNFTIQNNLTNDYEVNLRISYIFSGNYVNFYCKNMFKNPNSSHYIFFGGAVDSTSPVYDYRYLKIIGLKVNVGEANEWTLYTNSQNRIFGSAFALFDEDDNVMFRCLNTSTLTSSRTIDCTSKTYTGTVQTSSIATFDFHPFVDDEDYKKQSVFLSMDEVYFVQNNQRWGVTGTPNSKYIGLYKYIFSTDKFTTIYEKSLGNYDYSDLEAIYIDKCDTDIYVQYNTNIIGNPNNTADYYFQRLTNDTWNPILIGETENFIYNQRIMFIKSNFNLLQVYLYATNPRPQTWFQYLIKEDYNVLNYNGESYVDYNSTVPYKAEVYSNNSLVFARNLYNLTTNDNQSNATVVIPNSYLNNIDLTNQNLLSQTNSSMIENSEIVTKNIYETLYLNFINTINVINEDTNINYPNTASYINTNINTGTQNNYETTTLSKIRINWVGTSETFPISWEAIDDTHKQINFSLYIQNPILSVDLISGDELTTYMTIDTSTLEVGNTYEITQKLRIE
jgi:hypothetical protein